MTDSVIRLDRLEKSYGRHRALRGLTVDIPPGAVGLLGPNGAGKTTLLKVLLGLLRPDGGEARVGALDPANKADRLKLRRSVGYMPEGDCLIPNMNAVEIVTMLGRLAGLAPSDAMTRAHEMLDYVELDEERYRGLDEYSTGMKQRLKLAQALVHDPDILLLDEPTNGLDPKGRRHMLALVHDLGHAQQKNVLLCSHLLPDVERTCDSIVVLNHGEVLETGTIADLTANDRTSVFVTVSGDDAAFARALEAAGIAFERDDAPGKSGRFRAELVEHDGDDLFRIAADTSCVVALLEPVRSSLDEIFVSRLASAEAAR